MSELKYIRPDMATVPVGTQKVTKHVVVEGRLIGQWLARVGTTPWTMLASDEREYCFDCGGIVGIGEPRIACDLSCWSFSVRVRHAEYALPYCRNVHDHLEWLGPHIYLPAYWVPAILTPETGERLCAWLESQLPLIVDEASELWANHRKAMAIAGVYVPPKEEK